MSEKHKETSHTRGNQKEQSPTTQLLNGSVAVSQTSSDEGFNRSRSSQEISGEDSIEKSTKELLQTKDFKSCDKKSFKIKRVPSNDSPEEIKRKAAAHWLKKQDELMIADATRRAQEQGLLPVPTRSHPPAGESHREGARAEEAQNEGSREGSRERGLSGWTEAAYNRQRSNSLSSNKASSQNGAGESTPEAPALTGSNLYNDSKVTLRYALVQQGGGRQGGGEDDAILLPGPHVFSKLMPPAAAGGGQAGGVQGKGRGGARLASSPPAPPSAPANSMSPPPLPGAEASPSPALNESDGTLYGPTSLPPPAPPPSCSCCGIFGGGGARQGGAASAI